jgi:hypothetical protein
MDLSIFEQWVVRIPCALHLTLLIRSLEQLLFFILTCYYACFFPLLNLLKNLSNNRIDKILIGSTIFENTKQFTMDNQLDAAGACPATYTKNTTTRNGNSRL